MRVRVAAKGGVEVFDGFLEGGHDAVFFVVGGEHDAHAHFGRLDRPGICDVGLCRVVILNADLAGLTVGKPAVVPAW